MDAVNNVIPVIVKRKNEYRRSEKNHDGGGKEIIVLWRKGREGENSVDRKEKEQANPTRKKKTKKKQKEPKKTKSKNERRRKEEGER